MLSNILRGYALLSGFFGGYFLILTMNGFSKGPGVEDLNALGEPLQSALVDTFCQSVLIIGVALISWALAEILDKK